MHISIGKTDDTSFSGWFCGAIRFSLILIAIAAGALLYLLLWAVHASLWIPDGKSILMTVYLSAITPACATVTSMAQLYDRDASHSSAIYVLSTLLSILTMPLMIGLFELLL